jgi:hypothetical protein
VSPATTNFNTPEPDRQQQYLPSVCVIAQQYSFPIFVSVRAFKNYYYFFFFFFLRRYNFEEVLAFIIISPF